MRSPSVVVLACAPLCGAALCGAALRRAVLYWALLCGELFEAACDPGRAGESRSEREDAPLAEAADDVVLAVVGERRITAEDLRRRLEAMPRRERSAYLDRAGKERLLDELVRAEVLALEAERRGVAREPDVAAAVEAALVAALGERLADEVPRPEAIAEDEVAAHYAAHRDEYRTMERRGIAARVYADRLAATRARDRYVRSGAGDAAWRALGDGDDGDLGHVGPPGDAAGDNPAVPEPLREALFRLGSVGEVAIVEDGGRHYLVRFASRTAAQDRSFSQVETNIRRKLARERFAARREAFIAAQRDKTPVTVDERALREVRVPEARAWDYPYRQKK